MSERQRLGVQDALWLEMDKPGNLMVVDSLFWTATPIDWDRFRDVTRERLWDRYPVFRSIVVRGEDGARYWEEQPDADPDSRYEHVVLPEPGGDAELQELIASQRTLPLVRDEPLWHALLVDGFHGGSAVLFRGHHAIADGIRLVQLTLSVFDTTPDGTVDARTAPMPTAPDQASWQAPAQPLASGRSTTSRVMSRATDTMRASLALTREAATNPVGTAHSAMTLSESLIGAVRSRASFLSAVPGDIDTARKLVLGTRNDLSRWSGTVGHRKSIAWSPPVPLQDVKAVARAASATVNDVLVTCLAESLRTYLEDHHALCHSVTWDVPVNLKPFDPDLPVELGNSFALVQLELPTNIDDPVRTLKVVRRRMNRIKSGHEAVVDFSIQALISGLNKRLYRATVDLLASRAIGVLTNVPGPQIPLYIAGQRVEGMMGWAPVTADQIMSFTIYSYDAKVFVGIAVDAGQVPDHEQIVDGFLNAFQRLSRLTLGRSAPT